MVLSLESEDATCSVFVIVCKKVANIPASGRKSAMVGCMPCDSDVHSLIPYSEPGYCRSWHCLHNSPEDIEKQYHLQKS